MCSRVKIFCFNSAEQLDRPAEIFILMHRCGGKSLINLKQDIPVKRKGLGLNHDFLQTDNSKYDISSII